MNKQNNSWTRSNTGRLQKWVQHLTDPNTNPETRAQNAAAAEEILTARPQLLTPRTAETLLGAHEPTPTTLEDEHFRPTYLVHNHQFINRIWKTVTHKHFQKLLTLADRKPELAYNLLISPAATERLTPEQKETFITYPSQAVRKVIAQNSGYTPEERYRALTDPTVSYWDQTRNPRPDNPNPWHETALYSVCHTQQPATRFDLHAISEECGWRPGTWEQWKQLIVSPITTVTWHALHQLPTKWHNTAINQLGELWEQWWTQPNWDATKPGLAAGSELKWRSAWNTLTCADGHFFPGDDLHILAVGTQPSDTTKYTQLTNLTKEAQQKPEKYHQYRLGALAGKSLGEMLNLGEDYPKLLTDPTAVRWMVDELDSEVSAHKDKSDYDQSLTDLVNRFLNTVELPLPELAAIVGHHKNSPNFSWLINNLLFRPYDKNPELIGAAKQFVPTEMWLQNHPAMLENYLHENWPQVDLTTLFQTIHTDSVQEPIDTLCATLTH